MGLHDKGIYQAVWPRGKRAARNVRFADRLSTLQGKTVCELWDWLFRGDEVFPAMEKELSNRYPGVKFVGYQEFGSTHGSQEKEMLDSLPEKLRKHGCDAVVSGLGC